MSGKMMDKDSSSIMNLDLERRIAHLLLWVIWIWLGAEIVLTQSNWIKDHDEELNVVWLNEEINRYPGDE